jgi:hypothetical protein
VSSEIKEKVVKFCEEHGIVKENILDLTKVGKFTYPSSLHEFYVPEGKNPRQGNQSPLSHAGGSPGVSQGNKVQLVTECALLCLCRLLSSGQRWTRGLSLQVGGLWRRGIWGD